MFKKIIQDRTNHGDLHGDGRMFTCYSTRMIEWEDLGKFVVALRDWYEVEGRSILEINTYHSSGVDPLTDEVQGPKDFGIEVIWKSK